MSYFEIETMQRFPVPSFIKNQYWNTCPWIIHDVICIKKVKIVNNNEHKYLCWFLAYILYYSLLRISLDVNMNLKIAQREGFKDINLSRNMLLSWNYVSNLFFHVFFVEMAIQLFLTKSLYYH